MQFLESYCTLLYFVSKNIVLKLKLYENNFVTLFEILWKEAVERFKETSQLMKNVRLGS